MMKKYFLLVLFLLLNTFVFLNPVNAKERKVLIQFNYNGPEASEFRLYCNNKLIHTIPYGVSGDEFTTDINQSHLEFVLSAIVGNTEYSSPPYIVDLPEKPQDFKIGKLNGKITIDYKKNKKNVFCESSFKTS